MKSKILKYLSKYTEITNELENIILENTLVKFFPKKTILLKEAQISNDCYFILKGCIRSYLIKNGEEKIIEFYTEGQVVLPSVYGQSKPSPYYLECLEDTIVTIGNPQLEKQTFQKYPQLESLSRIIAEKIISTKQESFTTYKTSSPEERYLNLLQNKPDLLQRVPNYQIASYLGVKPESLSRIKKRIIGKK